MSAHVLPDVTRADQFAYIIRLADDNLVYSHRLAEWIAWAPQLEEDMALTNIGLDLLGQARLMLTLAGELEGEGNGEDDLAYLREEQDFRCVDLVEQKYLHEFGNEIARLLVWSAYTVPLYEGLLESRNATLAEIAAKGIKEVRYHLDHAVSWVTRLGDGTEESHERMQKGLQDVWPLTADLFAVDDLLERMMRAGIAPDMERVEAAWRSIVTEAIERATLTVPDVNPRHGKGRQGVHSEHLGYALAEMQYVHRLHPGATW